MSIPNQKGRLANRSQYPVSAEVEELVLAKLPPYSSLRTHDVQLVVQAVRNGMTPKQVKTRFLGFLPKCTGMERWGVDRFLMSNLPKHFHHLLQCGQHCNRPTVLLLVVQGWQERFVEVVTNGAAPRLLVMLGKSGNHAYCADSGQQYKQTNGGYELTGRTISVKTIQQACDANRPRVPGIYIWD